MAPMSQSSAWSYEQSIDLLARMIKTQCLDAAPHESVWCDISDNLNRSEVLTRVHFLRFKLVMQASGQWKTINDLQANSGEHTLQNLTDKLSDILMDAIGTISLIDLYYAAVKLIKDECSVVRWDAWIPEFPNHLRHFIPISKEFQSIDSSILKRLKDRKVILTRLHTAFAQIRNSTYIAAELCDPICSDVLPSTKSKILASPARHVSSTPTKKRLAHQRTDSIENKREVSPPVHSPAQKRRRIRISESPPASDDVTLDECFIHHKRRRLTQQMAAIPPATMMYSLEEFTAEAGLHSRIHFLARIGPHWKLGSQHAVWHDIAKAVVPRLQLAKVDNVVAVDEWRRLHLILKRLNLWPLVKPYMALAGTFARQTRLAQLLLPQRRLLYHEGFI